MAFFRKARMIREQAGIIRDQASAMAQQASFIAAQEAELREAKRTIDFKNDAIAERERAIEERDHASLFDTKTGLPNGNKLTADLLAIINDMIHSGNERREEEKERIGDTVVMFIDMRGMKRINDSVNHNAGDRAVREFFAALARTTRHGAVYKLHETGDEGVVVVSGKRAPTELQARERASDAANRVVVRIRDEVSKIRIPELPQYRLGMHIGTASLRQIIGENPKEAAEDIARLVYERADESANEQRRLRRLPRA